jgi:hypothetical protein
MGMLRSGAESELVKTLDYHGASGTIQVDGQPCTLTKYRVQANYQFPGWRTQIECVRGASKQKYSNVETVSGTFAWDEDIPGAELVPGKGKATPKPAALEERLIRLWASPHGAVKAAIAGAAGLPPAESFGQNPAVLLDRQEKAGAKSTTTLTWQADKAGEKAVLTFPIPGVEGAMATATLTNYLPDSVVVTRGTDKTEFVYGKFADWNNPLFKIEALYAGTIIERKNGTVVRNVTTKVTENRPDIRRHARAGKREEGWKVRNAMKASLLLITLSLLVAPMLAGQGPAQVVRPGRSRRRRSAGDPAAAPTPRLPNGKPDLTGSWVEEVGVLRVPVRRVRPWAACSGGARRSNRSSVWSGPTRARTGRSCRPRGSICVCQSTSPSTGTK